MVGVGEGDHALPAGEGPGEFDSVLDRLGTGVGEERLGWPRAGHPGVEPFGHADIALVGDHVDACMDEPIERPADGRDDGGLAMAQIGDTDPGGEVEQLVAINVGDHRALGLGRHDRRDVEGTVRDLPLAGCEDFAALRPGHGSLELNRGHGIASGGP